VVEEPKEEKLKDWDDDMFDFIDDGRFDEGADPRE
jgi:hypothetical protein